MPNWFTGSSGLHYEYIIPCIPFTLGSTTMELYLSSLSHIHRYISVCISFVPWTILTPVCWQWEHANKHNTQGYPRSRWWLWGMLPWRKREPSLSRGWTVVSACWASLHSAWWTQQKTSKKLRRNWGCCLCPNFFRCSGWKWLCPRVWHSLLGWGDAWAWQSLPSSCFLPQRVEVRTEMWSCCCCFLSLFVCASCVCSLYGNKSRKREEKLGFPARSGFYLISISKKRLNWRWGGVLQDFPLTSR